MVKDYYSILGVDRAADADTIKKAYRKLASQHHPDRGGETQRFQEIQEAYSILSDDQKRAQYDNPQPQFHFQGANFGPNGFNFDDIFNMFGVNMRGGHHHATPRVTIWISLEDVARGGPRVISLQTPQQVSNVEINIPQGIEDGESVRYVKLAPNGQDLIITYRIKPDPRWQRDRANLHTDVNVDLWTLVVGGQVPVTDLLGSTLMLTVPPRTNPGSILRMRGRGLPPNSLPGRGGPVGDLMVRVQARIPDNISPDLIAAIERERSR